MAREWTPEDTIYVKKWYNDKVKVSPAILAWKLGYRLAEFINILSKLGIRKKRHVERY